MDFEVWDKSKPDVSFNAATITFPAFEFYKHQAQMIADQINNTTVSEDTVKEAKALLADARRVSDGLNRRRIGIKKEILGEFTTFEAQVKELVEIVDSADGELRKKVRLLEEIERDKKEEAVKDLWEKRVSTYQIADLVPDAFDRWLTPQMLNKSTSMKAVEANMVDWLEESEKAIDTLKTMDDEYLVEYIGCLDFATAVATVNHRQELKTMITSTTDEDDTIKADFTVYGKKDIKFTESLLTENEITFIKH